MVLYLIIISIAVFFISLLNIFFGAINLGYSPLYIIFAAVVSTILVIAVDGLFAHVAHSLPAKWVNPFLKFHKVNKFEKKLYEKLQVRKWKDHIPDLGFLVKFRKNKINEPNNIEYIYKYMEECVFGEIGHNISLFAGFVICFAFPLNLAVFVGVPVAIVNFVLNLMPTMTLRYNRAKLMVLYKRMERKQGGAEKKQIAIENDDEEFVNKEV